MNARLVARAAVLALTLVLTTGTAATGDSAPPQGPFRTGMALDTSQVLDGRTDLTDLWP